VRRVAFALTFLLATACSAVSPVTRSTTSRIASVETSSPAQVSPTADTVRFEGGISPLRGLARNHVRRLNWHPGCPVPLSALRLVRVTYVNFRGEIRSGPLVLNAKVAHDVLWVFRQLFRARFPIHRIGLSPRPQPIDWNSTRNLTSSFNCRAATGNPGVLSEHSYGWAVDINPLQNPYVRLDGSVLRAAAKPFVDRSRDVPGMIHPDDVVVRSFAKIGWGWGGDWHTLKDYMHFSLTGR
jgi:D-alanyl-D-alanine carboxypeptidase-like protein